MHTKFTAHQLRAAANRLGVTVEAMLGRTLGAGPWDVWQLTTYAKEASFNLVTLGRVIENACANPPADGLQEKVPVAGEDDIITARELKDELARTPYGNLRMSRVSTDAFADQIMKSAAGRREPEYTPGTVVKDANGVYYQRTKSKRWQGFGLVHSFDHDYPKRPLEVM